MAQLRFEPCPFQTSQEYYHYNDSATEVLLLNSILKFQ